MYKDDYALGPTPTPRPLSREAQGAIRALKGVAQFFRAGIDNLGPVLTEYDKSMIMNDVGYIEGTIGRFEAEGDIAFETLERSASAEQSVNDTLVAALFVALMTGKGPFGDGRTEGHGGVTPTPTERKEVIDPPSFGRRQG